MHDQLERYWQELAGMAFAMPSDGLADAAEMLLDCYGRGGTVFVVGNGGSASTATHFACDLAKGTRTEGAPPFRVVALTDNAALMTAWANDTSYERVFAEQLAALVRPGDTLVAISASGQSPNVLLAAEVARGADAATIALTGAGGGQLGRLADLVVETPAGLIEQVEDLHLIMAHSLCVVLRSRMRAAAEAATLEPAPLALQVVEATA